MIKSFKIAIIFLLLNSNLILIDCACPISDNPTQMVQCLTINPQALVDLIVKNDFKSFCQLANGYMSCLTTMVRECFGGKAASGLLEELQDLNLKCCISGRTQECVFKNPEILNQCFSNDNFVTMANGRLKLIRDIQIGDMVKSIDAAGNLINSEIVSILHKDSKTLAFFNTIYDSMNNSISLTNSHLIFVKDQGYINAGKIKIGDTLRIYSNKNLKFKDFQVKRISFDIKKGFIAPLTNQGTLLVNQIDTSCYAEVNNHNLADIAMTPVKVWYKLSKLLGSSSSNKENEEVKVDLYSSYLYKFASRFLPLFFL